MTEHGVLWGGSNWWGLSQLLGQVTEGKTNRLPVTHRMTAYGFHVVTQRAPRAEQQRARRPRSQTS